MYHMSAWCVGNVSAIRARWLFTCEGIRVNALTPVGFVAVGSHNTAPWMFTSASTPMPGHMCVQSVAVASSSGRCYVTTCVCTPRSVLTAAQRVVKAFATTICGACTSACIRVNSRLYANAVQHALNRALHSAVTWGHMLPSVTAIVMFVAKAFRSAVIFVLTCVSIRARDHLSVMYVDSSLHITVHWRNIWLDMAAVLCWLEHVHWLSNCNKGITVDSLVHTCDKHHCVTLLPVCCVSS